MSSVWNFCALSSEVILWENQQWHYKKSAVFPGYFFMSHKDPVYLAASLNSELNKLSTWFKANKLSLNLKKTNFMLFKPRQKRYHFPMQICINEQRIEQVKETVFLGVVLDEHLSWKPHISQVARKISKSIGVINRARFFLPEPCLKTLYY